MVGERALEKGHVSLANQIALKLVIIAAAMSAAFLLLSSSKYALGIVSGVGIALINIYLTAAFVSLVGSAVRGLSSAQSSSIKLGGSLVTAVGYLFRFFILVASLFFVVKIPGIDILTALISLLVAHTFFCFASIGFSVNGLRELFKEV